MVRLEQRVCEKASVLAVEQAAYESMKGELACLKIEIEAAKNFQQGKGKRAYIDTGSCIM